MVFIFDGKKEAEKIKGDLKKRLALVKKRIVLEVISIGSDPVNENYLKSLRKIGVELGVGLKIKRFAGQNRPDSESGFSQIAAFIKKENQNPAVDGLLVQVSPKSLVYHQREKLVNLVEPGKDIDYLGKKFFKDKKRLSSVCRAILMAIGQAGRVLSLKPEWVNVLVIGNRGFWGRRIQQTLVNQGFEKVTGVDKEVVDLMPKTRPADILISCTGQPDLIKGEMIKKGSVLIDLGLSPNPGRPGKFRGDIETDSVKKLAGFLTPVPGGIGPLAVVLVFKNRFAIPDRQAKNNED
jgi:methylenetetrahydrofolate dehydrogenase (NADP+)/methenyltetrahydrofolate cyclohydrolase